MSDPLADDMERLANIGDEILAGTPIGEFDLTPLEVVLVTSYCRAGVESFMGPVEDPPTNRPGA